MFPFHAALYTTERAHSSSAWRAVPSSSHGSSKSASDATRAESDARCLASWMMPLRRLEYQLSGVSPANHPVPLTVG